MGIYSITCIGCGDKDILNLDPVDLYNWQTLKQPIEKCFPSLTKDQRNWLVHDYCPVCFPKAIGDPRAFEESE